MSDKDQEDFETWQKQWDIASEQFAKEFAGKMHTKPEQPQASWFTGAPSDQNYQEKDFEADPDWVNIYNGSYDHEGVINESQVKYDKGEKKPTIAFGGFTPTKTNPTQQSSIGSDAVDEDGNLRVTSNWTDSPDLKELEDIKVQIEKLERKHHSDEVTTEKPSSKLESEIKSLRSRIRSLSEKINRSPEVDVT